MKRKYPNPTGFRAISCLMLAGLLATMILFQSGCQIKVSYGSTTAIIDTTFTDKPTATTTIAPTTKKTTEPSETTTAAVTPKPTSTFEQKVRSILLTGLKARQRAISLDKAIEGQKIPEAKIQAALDTVFAIYGDLYNLHPEFYYLDGASNISYTVTQGQTDYLKSLTLKPKYLAMTEKLSAQQLDQLISQIDKIVNPLVAQIKKKTSKPWEQLVLVHDYLVKHIAYDESMDQDKNNVIWALRDGETLCEGYSRSFQLIAQRLGFDVRIISGYSGEIAHAWNMVKLDGKFYHVDVTHDDPTPDGGPDRPIQHVHFMRSDAVMKATHKWIAADFPKCSTDGAMYYRQNKLVADSRSTLYNKVNKFIDTINFDSNQIRLIELLYTGSDLPSQETFEEQVKAKLRNAAAGHYLYYRIEISKKVASVEISPEN